MRRLLLPVLALAACNSGSSAPAPAQLQLKPTVSLGSDNAIDASRACIRSAFDIERVTYVGVSMLNVPRPVDEPAGVGLGAALISREIFDQFGASATLTWDDRDGNDKYTTGDVFTIDFNGYTDQGVLLDGTMQISGLTIAGPLPSLGVWVANGTLELLNVTLTIGSQQWPITSKIPFHYENRQVVELFEVELPEDVQLGPYTVQAGSSFARYERLDSVAHSYSGAVFAADLDGMLTYESESFLGGFPFFADPTTGKFFVYGTQRSRLELEPGFFTLDIRVDVDGDGAFEDEIPTSFFALVP
ncbi:MAG: hypothetical protein H6835_09795 [Planctomycetes bacterium]|nr:hypothetical protein [Planctomycetota bacterium]